VMETPNFEPKKFLPSLEVFFKFAKKELMRIMRDGNPFAE